MYEMYSSFFLISKLKVVFLHIVICICVGAAVSTRGRYLNQEERTRNPGERPLYLHIQAATKQAIDCKKEQ